MLWRDEEGSWGGCFGMRKCSTWVESCRTSPDSPGAWSSSLPLRNSCRDNESPVEATSPDPCRGSFSDPWPICCCTTDQASVLRMQGVLDAHGCCDNKSQFWLSGLKKHNALSDGSGGWRSDTGLTRLKSRCQYVCVPSEAPGENHFHLYSF